MSIPPMLQAAIPGQSLTDKPGNAPWEHPPKYTDPHEAVNFLVKQMMDPESAAQILMMLKAGTPVDWIAHTFLFTGFGKGLWLPPLIILMAKPIIATIIAMGKRAGIKMVYTFPKPIDQTNIQLAQLIKAKEEPDMQTMIEEASNPDQKPPGTAQAPSLMKRPNAGGVQ